MSGSSDHVLSDPSVGLAEQLDRIRSDRGGINAIITATPDLALADLERLVSTRKRGIRLPLDGMTVVVKDNIDIAGVRGTRGSRWCSDRISVGDATVVSRLRRAGALIVGTANMHEFAFGATSNNPHFGPVRNPWDLSRIPGGSSGGSAAAVAARWATGALGTDTGGSVRCPAALCGVSGLRPTFGVISNYRSYPIGPIADTVGPMAQRAKDVGRLFAALQGYDPLDPDSVPYVGMVGAQNNDVWSNRGLRVGVLSDWFQESIDLEVAAAFLEGVETLRGQGASIRQVEISCAERANEVAKTLVNVEALAIHQQRLKEDPNMFGEDVARRLRLGAGLMGWEVAALYREAKQLRRKLLEPFSDLDVLVSPTVPRPAVPIEAAEMISTTLDMTRFTYLWGIAGVPALSVPCGFSSANLPLGLQIVGPPHADMLLCAVGEAYQRVTDWHLRTPPPYSGATTEV